MDNNVKQINKMLQLNILKLNQNLIEGRFYMFMMQQLSKNILHFKELITNKQMFYIKLLFTNFYSFLGHDSRI